MLQILEKGISWLYRDKLNRKKKNFHAGNSCACYQKETNATKDISAGAG